MDARHQEFLSLFLRSQAAIEAFVHSVVRDRAAADDVAQEVALVLWSEFTRYDRERPFLPWARGVAANMVLRHLKDRHRGILCLGPEAVEALLDAHEAVYRDEAARQQALRRCLEQLPDKSRTLVALRYAHGFSFDEMATRIGATGDAVRKAVSRLRDGLRECIAQHTIKLRAPEWKGEA